MNTVLITGCSGYIGKLLVTALCAEKQVHKVVGLDKDTPDKELLSNKKFVFIKHNTVDTWEKEVEEYKPTAVVHLAWQIRELWGMRSTVHQWNINGSHRVFDYVFNHHEVKTLIHFSSVACYGAYESNRLEYIFDENHSLRHTNYMYAEEKREVEGILESLYKQYADHIEHLPHVYVMRPASVTGPVGRERTSFGLQSVLLGKAGGSKIVEYFAKLAQMLPLPVTPQFSRQFVHESDVIQAVLAALKNTKDVEYSIFNLAGGGPITTGKKYAQYLKKKTIVIHPELLRIAFALLWYGTRGKIGTSPGSYKTYSYPIVVSGEKIEKELDFSYAYTSDEALKN